MVPTRENRLTSFSQQNEEACEGRASRTERLTRHVDAHPALKAIRLGAREAHGGSNRLGSLS